MLTLAMLSRSLAELGIARALGTASTLPYSIKLPIVVEQRGVGVLTEQRQVQSWADTGHTGRGSCSPAGSESDSGEASLFAVASRATVLDAAGRDVVVLTIRLFSIETAFSIS